MRELIFAFCFYLMRVNAFGKIKYVRVCVCVCVFRNEDNGNNYSGCGKGSATEGKLMHHGKSTQSTKSVHLFFSLDINLRKKHLIYIIIAS